MSSDLKLITISVPSFEIESIKSLVDAGYFNSSSEFFREAVREFLDKEVDKNELIQPENIAYMLLEIQTLKNRGK